MLGGIGLSELIVIFAIVVVIFGAKRLPEIGAGLGRGIRNFRSAMDGSGESIKNAIKEGEQPPGQDNTK